MSTPPTYPIAVGVPVTKPVRPPLAAVPALPSFVFQDLRQPPSSGLYEVLVNYWWIVDSATREMCIYISRRGLRAPQANSDKGVMEHLMGKGMIKYGDRQVELEQIPLAFIRRRFGDY